MKPFEYQRQRDIIHEGDELGGIINEDLKEEAQEGYKSLGKYLKNLEDGVRKTYDKLQAERHWNKELQTELDETKAEVKRLTGILSSITELANLKLDKTDEGK